MKQYTDITYIIGYCEGNPIHGHLTIQEQKDIEKIDGLSVNEVIDMDIKSYWDNFNN